MAQYKALYEQAIHDQADLRHQLEKLRREHEALTQKYQNVRRIQQEYDTNEILYNEWKKQNETFLMRFLTESVMPDLHISETNQIFFEN